MSLGSDTLLHATCTCTLESLIDVSLPYFTPSPPTYRAAITRTSVPLVEALPPA
jgi:hypothetical protein